MRRPRLPPPLSRERLFLECVAYHEAAHVVMAEVVRTTPARGVTIVPRGENAGSTTFHCFDPRRYLRPEAMLSPEQRELQRYVVEQHCMVLLAGVAAESRAGFRLLPGTPRYVPGLNGDYLEALSYLEVLEPDEARRGRWMARLQRRTRRFLRYPELWHAVELLQAKLMRVRTLDDEALTRFMAQPGGVDDTLRPLCDVLPFGTFRRRPRRQPTPAPPPAPAPGRSRSVGRARRQGRKR